MLEKHGEYLCINDVARILGADRGTIRLWLKDVPYLPLGKKKLYAIADLAEVLYRRQI